MRILTDSPEPPPRKYYARLGHGRGEEYPWDDWADGQTREAVHGVDFRCAPSSFRSAVAGWAARNFTTHSARVVGDTVQFRLGPLSQEARRFRDSRIQTIKEQVRFKIH